MARVLMLDFQLDCLNYDPHDWYHNDLDFEIFKLLQMEKGESLFTSTRDMTPRSKKAMYTPLQSLKNLVHGYLYYYGPSVCYLYLLLTCFH